MLPLKTILCPVDFSGSSLSALAIAVELGVHFKAEVHVLHVLELHQTSASSDGLLNGPSVATLHKKELNDDIRQSMANALEKYSSTNVLLRALIEEGESAPTIVRQSSDICADMIVISTHGRSGLRRLMFGSVAEAVIRTAPCPVLTVRPSHSVDEVDDVNRQPSR